MNLEQHKPAEQEKEPQELRHELSGDQIIDRFRDMHVVKEMPDVELPSNIVNTQPRFKQLEIAEEILEQQQGLVQSMRDNPEEIRAFLEDQSQRLNQKLYKLDEKTGLNNGDFFRLNLQEILEEELSTTEVDTYDHVACVYLDINGLKRVNDLNGHDNGDEFLKRIGDWLSSSEVLTDLSMEGAEISRARLQGDEFAIMVKDTPDGETDWNRKWTGVQIALQKELGRIEVSDILPVDKVRDHVPTIASDFKFKATAAIGIKTGQEALFGSAEMQKNIITKDDTSITISKKIVGTMIAGSDAKMQKNKTYIKKMLEIGDENEQTLAQLSKH